MRDRGVYAKKKGKYSFVSFDMKFFETSVLKVSTLHLSKSFIMLKMLVDYACLSVGHKEREREKK